MQEPVGMLFGFYAKGTLNSSSRECNNQNKNKKTKTKRVSRAYKTSVL